MSADAQQRADIERHLDSQLKGRLPCIGCRYELQGLTVRGECPECGLAIRATILYQVDPQAEAFRPLFRPRITAWGTVAWLLAALVAALLAWMPRIEDLLQRSFKLNPTLPRVGALPALFIAISGLASLVLIYPSEQTTRSQRLAATIAFLAYVPLTALVWWLYTSLDPGRAPPYFVGEPQPDRILLRLGLSALIVVILLGMRPNARRLAARSIILRTGRVDRQTIAATVAAVIVTVLGDLIRLCSIPLPTAKGSWVSGFGTLVVLVGSLFFTLALLGAVVDSWRIRRAILTPTPSLRQLTS